MESLITSTGAAAVEGSIQAPVQKPLLGMPVKDVPKSWGIQGALVSDVMPGSPADYAGIMPGDIITGMDGRPVNSASDLTGTVSSLSDERICRVTVRRGVQVLDLDMHAPAHGEFQGASSSARSSLTSFNVLKYAAIDPQTRSVVLVGSYDPAFNTGPIPYYDLLADALRSPYPWFSLEPTDETRNAVARIHEAIGADVQRMHSDPVFVTQWANRLMSLILNDPAMARDRARFVGKGAEAFGISEDEMLKVLAKSANDPSVTTDELMPILGKVLKGLGYDMLGEALVMQHEGPEATFSRLGIYEQASPIINAYKSGQMSEQDATLQITVMMMSAILRGLRVPDSEIDFRAKAVLNGRMPMSTFNQFMEEILMTVIMDGAGLKMFNGLTLSNQLLNKLYNAPAPQMNLVFRDVPDDSLLGDTLFRADYALKSICTDPDNNKAIPGFMTEMEHLHRTAADMGVRIPGDAGAELGHTLVPGDVILRVSPEGTLLAFDDARVRVTGRVLDNVGSRNTSEVQHVISTAAAGYADYLTQHYDDLARVFPDLHRLREAQKLIALARWAQAGNMRIIADRAAGVKMAQAPSAQGFWQGVFVANPDEFGLVVITRGGVSFDTEQGDAWVRTSPDVTVTDNVLEQLAYSTSFARQAADAAGAGDLDAARDFAEKSALAMTGAIDFTQYPALDVPMPGEPAHAASLVIEAQSVTDQSFKAIENSKVNMELADKMESASPQDAVQLRQMAEQQRRQAESKLQALRDALDMVRADPGKTGDAVAAIRNISAMPSNLTAPPAVAAPHAGAPAGSAVSVPAAKPKTSKSREELILELDRLEIEMESVTTQLSKLSGNIMRNQQQFQEWQDVAQSGMDKCRDVLFGLFMDASAGKLADRYETMYDLAKKLPDQPQPLIKRLGRTNDLFTALKDAKSFKDVLDWAYAEGDTLPGAIEKIRDGIGLITSLKGWDKTLVGAAWTYGSNMVDLTYAFTQFSLSYDAVMLQEKNVEEFNKALASLKSRMQDLVVRTKQVKEQLAGLTDDELLQ